MGKIITMKQTKQRGGKRIGSGRKPGIKKARNKIARSIILHRLTWEQIETKRGGLTPSKYIEKLLQ
jgi:hypothetical protein